jgi:putative membrane protein
MWHPLDFWGWWMIPGFVWMIAFWGFIIWLLVTLVNRSNTPTDNRPQSNAMAILEERYARGEITKEQFEEMRRTLRTG